MALLTIGSNNPNFSFIIAKNPITIRESGKPFTRELRKGVVYGWYTDGKNDQEFRLQFRDDPVRSSFAEGLSEEFEYLDRGRYGSPYLPIAMLTKALASAMKKQDEKDIEGYEAYITTNIKVSNRRYMEQMIVHYAGNATITAIDLPGKYATIMVKASTIHHTLNVMQVICLLQSLADEETHVETKNDIIEKFIGVINAAQAPYFMRYLFQMKAINNRDVFMKYRTLLCTDTIQLNFGNTRQQRYDAIKPYLPGGEVLLDIGCGEMFYAMHMVKRYTIVHAIDADEERTTNNVGKASGRKIENLEATHVEVTADWVAEHAGLFAGADVLLTEVAEHIPFEEATALVEAILRTECRRLIVTCPNRDFNFYYGIPEGDTRHYDHKWEPSKEEFDNWCLSMVKGTNRPYEFTGIGDSVNGCHTSLMAVFF